MHEAHPHHRGVPTHMGQAVISGRAHGRGARLLDEAYAMARLGETVLIVTPHLRVWLRCPPVGVDVPVRRALCPPSGVHATGRPPAPRLGP